MTSFEKPGLSDCMTPETSENAANGLGVAGAAALVSDAEIDALVSAGYDWHSAYRLLQSSAHSRNTPTQEARHD